MTAVLAAWRPRRRRRPRRPLVEVPTVYDGADLAEVAELWGVSAEAAVRIHTGPEYRVAFCGFAPGFAYLTGLPARYEVPRRATPRTSVPAGSVALAGPYTGVYPRSSPGGWQLLGRTDLPLWDAARDPAALLAPGVRVRFTAARHRMSALEVVRPGPLTTVQDLGRRGVAHLGVPRAGALDEPALRAANRLVGNAPGAAGLETTLGGVALRATRPVWWR